MYTAASTCSIGLAWWDHEREWRILNNVFWLRRFGALLFWNMLPVIRLAILPLQYARRWPHDTKLPTALTNVSLQERDFFGFSGAGAFSRICPKYMKATRTREQWNIGPRTYMRIFCQTLFK